MNQMNRIFLLFFCLSPLISAGQEEENDRLFEFSLYVGGPVGDQMLNIDYIFKSPSGQFVGLPVGLGLKTEMELGPKTGLTLDLNYVHVGLTSNRLRDPAVSGLPETEFHKRTSTTYRLLVGLNSYFNNTESFQSFLSFNLGVKYVERMRTIDGEKAPLFFVYPKFNISESEKFISPSFRIALGFKRYFENQLFVRGEIGLGSNPAQLGLGMRF
jgi:hypothetical protein